MDHFYFFIYFLGVKISGNQWLFPPFGFSAASTFSWCLFVAHSAFSFVFSKVSCVWLTSGDWLHNWRISHFTEWETPLASIQAHNQTESMLCLCLLLNSYLVFLFLSMISGFDLVVNPVVYFHEGIHSWTKASLDCNDDDHTPTFSSSWLFF